VCCCDLVVVDEIVTYVNRFSPLVCRNLLPCCGTVRCESLLSAFRRLRELIAGPDRCCQWFNVRVISETQIGTAQHE